jgi:predicted membrane protein
MKKWYQSKTIIINLLTLLVTIIGNVTGAIHLNEQTLKVLGVVVTVVNIALRFLSTTAIDTGQKA